MGPPLTPSKIGHAQPGLVYVQHHLVLSNQVYEPQGELLPQHEILLLVRRLGHGRYLSVPHLEFVPHDTG